MGIKIKQKTGRYNIRQVTGLYSVRQVTGLYNVREIGIYTEAGGGVAEPTVQPSSFVFTNVGKTSMDISWTAGNGTHTIILRSTSAITDVPVDLSNYSVGDTIGSCTVASFGTGTSFTDSGLTAYTQYFYAGFAVNGATGTWNYLTTSPLTDSEITLFDLGNAIHLDGSNDSVDGTVTSVLGGGNAFVCEFFFKADGSTFGTSVILGCRNVAQSAGWGLLTLTGTKTIRFQVFNGANTYGSYTLASVDVKTHVRVVYDGTQSTNATKLRVWINGSEVTLSYTGTIPTTIGNSGVPIYIGKHPSNLNYFDGWIDHFCLWNNTTGSDTYNGGAGAPPSATGLIRYLKFDESNPATNCVDQTGNDTFTASNINYDTNSEFGVLT